MGVFHRLMKTWWDSADPFTLYSLVNNFYWTASALCENWGRVSGPSGEYYNIKLQDWSWLFLALCLSLPPLLVFFLSYLKCTKSTEGNGGSEKDRESGRVRRGLGGTVGETLWSNGWLEKAWKFWSYNSEQDQNALLNTAGRKGTFSH